MRIDDQTYQKTRSADQAHKVVALGNASRLLDRHRGPATAIDMEHRVNVPSQVPNLTKIIAK